MIRRLLRRVWHAPSPLANALALGATVCVLVAPRTGGRALVAVAALALALLGLAAVLVLLPARSRVEVVLRPPRTSVGSQVRGRVRVHHRGPMPLLDATVVLGGPGGPQRIPLGFLRPGARREQSFDLTATRRGVFPVGPPYVAREDPLGLVRWDRRSGPVTELYVRPRTVPLTSLGAGSIHDIEGVASDRVSMSDLAFHALREYTRGDDLRHVHWRSSAKADRLLVRQYQDSRRTRATIVVDSAAGAFVDAADFEIAMSVAASMALRAALDDLELSLFCGPERIVNGGPDVVLDACCRAAPGDEPLEQTITRAAQEVPDTSLLVLVTGTARDDAELTRLGTHLGLDAQHLVLRCGGDAEASLRVAGGVTIAGIGVLEHLPAVVARFLGDLS